MNNKKFQILGETTPPMVGRKGIFENLLNSLRKEVPDHIQMIGAKFSGKTVILKSLADALRRPGSPFLSVVLWDLGHQTPGSDESFMQGLAQKLSEGLWDSNREYAEHLRGNEANPFNEISEVLDLLKEESMKVLLILDGFDKTVSNGNLSRNLWDQLLDLARKPSLRILTSSRLSLYDLLRSPDSKTSDFWGVFDTKIYVRCFDKDDVEEVLSNFDGRKFSGGALTELWNVCNGYPIATLGVLNLLPDEDTANEVTPKEMNEACEAAAFDLKEVVDALWIDCASSSQDLYRRLLDSGPINRAGIANPDVDTLVERGFIAIEGNKLVRPSRLVQNYLAGTGTENNAIASLFSSPASYMQNLSEVLDRRIAQLEDLDADLKRYLELGVKDLPDFPKHFFSSIRGILDHSLEMIWKAELGEKKIPSEWTATWRYNGEKKADEWLARFPQGGQRLRLLDLMTGTQRCDPCAKYVSKSTYVLANAIQGFGDFGQHQEGADIDPGTAYSALHLCIELSAALKRELPM